MRRVTFEMAGRPRRQMVAIGIQTKREMLTHTPQWGSSEEIRRLERTPVCPRNMYKPRCNSPRAVPPGNRSDGQANSGQDEQPSPMTWLFRRHPPWPASPITQWEQVGRTTQGACFFGIPVIRTRALSQQQPARMNPSQLAAWNTPIAIQRAGCPPGEPSPATPHLPPPPAMSRGIPIDRSAPA